MRVGLSFFVRAGNRTIWDNGGSQHCVCLLDTLRACPSVSEVCAINAGDGDVPDPAAKLDGIRFHRLADVADKLDVVIEAEAKLDPKLVDRVRARGGRSVAYRYGNAFVIDVESMIHGKGRIPVDDEATFDEVWTNPQHERTCAGYWETLLRAPVRVLPHVWDRRFVDLALREFPAGLPTAPRARPVDGPLRVGIFEPNINICKTAIIPILGCERALRDGVDLDVFVFCADGVAKNDGFRRWVRSLDLHRRGRISVEARYRTPWALAKHCDMVCSHQWENALNFLYYETLALGWPLVHNSSLLPGGFRYDGFDVADCAVRIAEVASGAAQDWASALMLRLDPVGAHAVEAHESALRGLFADSGRAAA